MKPRALVGALKRTGFLERGQRGSHLRLFNPMTKRQTVVPMHNKDLKRGTLHAILAQSGVTPEELQELL